MAVTAKQKAFIEEDIPRMAKQAFQDAYSRALQAGHSVLVADRGQLVRRDPDGTSFVIKALPQRHRVVLGKKIKLGG